MSATKRSVFILTTNNLHEIDRGVHDRCWGISMNAASDERWLPAAHQMLQKLGVSDVTDEAAIGVLATCSRQERTAHRFCSSADGSTAFAKRCLTNI